MTCKAEKYMGFTIKVYAHPVAGGFVPFCQVMCHGESDDEFNLKPHVKVHETVESAVGEAADWGRDLIDKLAILPDRRSWRHALAISPPCKEEQKRMGLTLSLQQ